MFEAMAGTTLPRNPSSIGMRDRWNTFGNAWRSSEATASLPPSSRANTLTGVAASWSKGSAKNATRRAGSLSPTALPGKARNVAPPTFTPASTSFGVARSTTNSEPPRFRKWWIEMTATRGGSSRTVTSLVTVVTASRYPNSTGRAAVTVMVALPAARAGCVVLPIGRITHRRSDDACFTSPAVPLASSSAKTGIC